MESLTRQEHDKYRKFREQDVSLLQHHYPTLFEGIYTTGVNLCTPSTFSQAGAFSSGSNQAKDYQDADPDEHRRSDESNDPVEDHRASSSAEIPSISEYIHIVHSLLGIVKGSQLYFYAIQYMQNQENRALFSDIDILKKKFGVLQVFFDDSHKLLYLVRAIDLMDGICEHSR
ncbi:hypothetical protein Adt_41465 [Abeliophyllum distichum]|uniref:Uncharacterized protein n=1 Tax=Abeliophyllum distichum TaxID=126358 RepID=A0ABD1PPS1_9LAMI